MGGTYLDAAAATVRCAGCDAPVGGAAAGYKPPVVKEASTGVLELANGGEVLYDPHFAFWADDTMFEQLLQEVAWEQHDDLLDDGRRVPMPRKIAYQAEDPANPRLIYDYENL